MAGVAAATRLGYELTNSYRKLGSIKAGAFPADLAEGSDWISSGKNSFAFLVIRERER